MGLAVGGAMFRLVKRVSHFDGFVDSSHGMNFSA
jgi:hypothetical protein